MQTTMRTRRYTAQTPRVRKPYDLGGIPTRVFVVGHGISTAKVCNGLPERPNPEALVRLCRCYVALPYDGSLHTIFT
jgi:hypothetical protein